MAGKVLDLKGIIQPDDLGCQIANHWIEWNTLRQVKINDWNEVRKYVYAVDTTTTTNSKLPWKNKTTLPKLCQIRDNLYANYMATLFPKRKWLKWDASNPQSLDKAKSITQYMSWVIIQEQFKTELSKLILDYIDYGNCFATVEWLDERVTIAEQGKEQIGYVGPVLRRINPTDIVFNPTAPAFPQSPKIVRSLITMGEAKKLIDSMTTDDNREEYEALYKYCIEIRREVRQSGTDLTNIDTQYQVDGFTSFRSYLESDYVEVLTFFGDLYDREKEELLQNYQIMVMDRHRVLSKKPHPSVFGHTPIYHAGWRPRQDNLWAMGPLDNLVGMQYRIDHIENLKADVFDLIAFPVLKIKGNLIEDFNWGPFERVYVGDEGDVEILAPPFQVLQANVEIQQLQAQMEEMAGAPKEAMGFRSPGEKTKYEVQRLENASARIFQNKVMQFEEQMVERVLNAMLEMARRKLAGTQQIPVFNDEFQYTTFATLTASDITGVGTLRPMAARHFAEKADIVQNLTAFFGSSIGQDPAVRVHFSGSKIANLFDDLLDIQDYELVAPYVRLEEEAQGQRLAMSYQEQTQTQMQTPSGLSPEDRSAGAPVLQPQPPGPGPAPAYQQGGPQ